MNKKWCYACKQHKPLLDFGKNKSKKDGLATECKKCKRKLDKASHQRNRETRLQGMKKWRQDNLEECRKKEREYSRSGHGRELNRKAHERYYETHKQQKSEYAKQYKINNPEKYKARTQFGNAIKLDKIQRSAHCQMCGVECVTNGHHKDYTKAFEVTYVCDSCHGKLHRKVV